MMRWTGYDPETDIDEYVGRCPACGDWIDFCQGHGPSGDPVGYVILTAHDDGIHAGCNPLGCEDAADERKSAIVAATDAVLELEAIRARASEVVARPAADGRYYSVEGQAIHDRETLLAEVDRLEAVVERNTCDDCGRVVGDHDLTVEH